MRIVSKNEMSELETQAINEYHLDERLIIENVAVEASKAIIEIARRENLGTEILFLIGRGNNGADGIATARHLTNLGHKCRAFVLFSESECKEELLSQIKIAKSFGVAVNFIESALDFSSYVEQTSPQILIDCIFGTGVHLPMSSFIYEIIDYVNSTTPFIFAMDIASGIEGDSGMVQGNAIKADITLAIGFPKLGHYVTQGPRFSGEVIVLNVGLPRKFETEGDKFLLQPEHMLDLVNPRDKFGDKKVFGHSLVIGGSHGLVGAPILAAKASLKVGSGLVTVATWEPQYNELTSRVIPEIMTGYISQDPSQWDRLIKDLNKYSSVVVGPGLARTETARRLVLEILNNFDGPVVIDADAIHVLRKDEDKEAFKLRNAPTILTPHFGEFAQFAGISYEELVQKPVYYLQSLVESINCTVVLKGPCTYLGTTDGSVYFNYSPNDGMATGGAGDVLAGMIGGLLGQDPEVNHKSPLITRYEAFNRTIAVALYLHSTAGYYASEAYGVRAMSAQTLIDSFPDAFSSLEKDFDKAYKEL